VKTPVRIAIIGQGRSGRDNHAEYLKTRPDRFKIVAAVDLIEDRRRRAARDYGCDAYTDYRELFQRRDLDLIINASFSYLHAPITLDILRHGYNVLCEKPMANKARDVDRLIAAARKAKRVFAIFQQGRFAPYFRQVRKVIASGVLGRIVQISIGFNGFGRRWDWQTLQAYNGGSLMNTGPHPLDQALVLFGDGLPEVRSYMDRANTFGDAEDHVKVILSGAGHPLIDLEVSSCCPYSAFTYRIGATRGGLSGTTTALEWKYFKPSEAPKQKLIEAPLRNANGLPIYPRETLTWHTGKWPESAPVDGKASTAEYSPAKAATASAKPVALFYDMLLRTLQHGVPLEITPEQIRRQAAVIEVCQKQNPAIYGKTGAKRRK